MQLLARRVLILQRGTVVLNLCRRRTQTRSAKVLPYIDPSHLIGPRREIYIQRGKFNINITETQPQPTDEAILAAEALLASKAKGAQLIQEDDE